MDLRLNLQWVAEYWASEPDLGFKWVSEYWASETDLGRRFGRGFKAQFTVGV